jgi:hypothetical protein
VCNEAWCDDPVSASTQLASLHLAKSYNQHGGHGGRSLKPPINFVWPTLPCVFNAPSQTPSSSASASAPKCACKLLATNASVFVKPCHVTSLSIHNCRASPVVHKQLPFPCPDQYPVQHTVAIEEPSACVPPSRCTLHTSHTCLCATAVTEGARFTPHVDHPHDHAL